MRELRRVSAVLFATVALTWLIAGPRPATAQARKSALLEGNPALAKVSSHLLRARELAAEGRSPAQIAAAVPSLRLRDGLPEVEVSLRSLTPALVEELRGRGLRIDSYHLGYARAYGRIDPADLDEIAALDEVIVIQPMPRYFTRVGAAESQADVTMRSFDVRSTLGYDGTGVKVGILSDSFNNFGGGTVSGSGCTRTVTGTSSQTSGDVPAASGEVLLLDDGPGGGSDEGRAIAELITDVAPGATFAFHSATNNPADFAAGIAELDGCSANLIVDDVAWTQQPFFQDGVIAAAAQAAVDNGTPYFSAAGNDATFGIHDAFLDVDPMNDTSGDFPPNGDNFHDFGGGDAFAAITLPDDCTIYAELQWSEPFASLGGAGSASDLDLYLLSTPVDPASTSGTNLLALSVSITGCGTPGPPSGDPLELVQYTNMTGAPRTVFLAIDQWCSPTDPLELRILTLSSGGPGCSNTGPGWDFEDGLDGGVPDPSETPIFVDPQIFGHPAAKDVVAVAAAFYGEIDSGGTLDPPPAQLDVEPFSSLGGDLPFFFDEVGGPLPGAPQTRFKPEVTGPDGTNTTFFGSDIVFDPDSDPNFFGTSAAAPNSAAVAALILDATDLKINPLPLKQLLAQSAIDMEFPGLDPLSGDGFTDALRPIRSLDPSTTPLIDDLEFDLDGGAFFSSPPTGGTQRLQANDSILFEDGDFTGIDALAQEHIFADGFESGDTSSWSNSVP